MSKERQAIYNKTNGKCYYCGCELPKRWHADHLKPVWRDVKAVVKDDGRVKYLYGQGEMQRPQFDTFENKVPSCPRCNIRKSTESLEQFRKSIANQINVLMRNSNSFKLALDYGLIEITDKEVEFYFEKEHNQ